MAAPFNNLRSKHNRAVQAYLLSLAVATPAIGTGNDIFAQASIQERGYPNTTVRTKFGIPQPMMTGDYKVRMEIEIKGAAAPANSDQSARMAFDARVAATHDALMMTDDNTTLNYTASQITAAGRALAISDPQNNGDMGDYSCINWFDAGFAEGDISDDPGCAWKEVLVFEAIISANDQT
jgi:hypothetical protein